MATKRARLPVLALLLLLAAAAAGSARASAPRDAPVQPPPAPTATPRITALPTPTGLPPADPRFGVLLAAAGYYAQEGLEILNHSVINLSHPNDCADCPIYALERAGLRTLLAGIESVLLPHEGTMTG